MGRRLAALRDEGIMLVASGNVVHNLRTARWHGEGEPYPWAESFNNFVKENLTWRGEAADHPLVNYLDHPGGSLSNPTALTLLAGGATFIGALLGVLGQKPSNRLLAFSLGFAAGIMLLISLMEMLPAALGEEGMSPVLGYGMFIVGLLGYFALDRLLPHAHPQDLIDPPPAHASRNLRRTALLLTLGISLHNFPEGIATYVTASTNLELGFGIALAVALHNIPEGLAVAGPVYAATGSRRKAVIWAGLSGMAEILGGVLAWLILGTMVSPVVMAAIMAAVAGIMVALSVDELMPLAKEIDPHNNPSYGVLCGMSVMGLSLTLLQTSGLSG